MTHVVFLRGMNVGGHRRFRPSVFVRHLKHLDAVSIGATGIFVIRKAMGRKKLTVEFARRLPFGTEVFILRAREVSDFLTAAPFSRRPIPRGAVPFFSILSRKTGRGPRLPFDLPSAGPWLVRILWQRGRFVFGFYRRHMKVIGSLGRIDRIYGARATTRSWGTMQEIGRILGLQK
jgi:hypothetical protein